MKELFHSVNGTLASTLPHMRQYLYTLSMKNAYVNCYTFFDTAVK